MRKKFNFIIWKKKITILEPTVEQFWLSMESTEDFFFEIFWWKIPKMEEKQLQTILNTIFWVENTVENELLGWKDKKDEDDFHIVVARLMKYFWNSYKEIMEIPISIFRKILKDFEKIEWNNEKKSEKEEISISELKALSNL